MNGVKSSTLFQVFLLNCLMLLVLSDPTLDNSLTDLYESLLQKEYTGPMSFTNHQVERKAQRSPSLRLRFGRRSDPSVPLMEKRFFDEVNQKPIRSPSLRLRFGKRNGYEMDNDYITEVEMLREPRMPNARLRWGRSDPDVSIIDDDNMIIGNDLDDQPKKRKSVRLRWGRSYNSVPEQSTELHQKDELSDASKLTSTPTNQLGRLGF